MQVDKKPEKILKLFDDISFMYDKMNNFISFGTHYFIKKKAVELLNISSKTRVLDICCGSGDLAKIIQNKYKDVEITGVDFSTKMLELAKKKNKKANFILSDCTKMSFLDEEFDFATMAFGLRNIKNDDLAIKEAFRVLKKNGKLLHLDFGESNFFSGIFDCLILFFAKFLKKYAKHYEYLICSKQSFYSQKELVEKFQKQGFVLEKRKDFLFGIISAQVFEKMDFKCCDK